MLTFAKDNLGRFADINTSPTLSPSPSTSYQTPVIDTLNILSNVSNTLRKRLPKQQALTHLQPSKPFEPPIAPSITQMHIFLPYQTPQHKCSPQIHPRRTFITHTSTQSNTSEPCKIQLPRTRPCKSFPAQQQTIHDPTPTPHRIHRVRAATTTSHLPRYHAAQIAAQKHAAGTRHDYSYTEGWPGRHRHRHHAMHYCGK